MPEVECRTLAGDAWTVILDDGSTVADLRSSVNYRSAVGQLFAEGRTLDDDETLPWPCEAEGSKRLVVHVAPVTTARLDVPKPDVATPVFRSWLFVLAVCCCLLIAAGLTMLVASGEMPAELRQQVPYTWNGHYELVEYNKLNQQSSATARSLNSPLALPFPPGNPHDFLQSMERGHNAKPADVSSPSSGTEHLSSNETRTSVAVPSAKHPLTSITKVARSAIGVMCDVSTQYIQQLLRFLISLTKARVCLDLKATHCARGRK